MDMQNIEKQIEELKSRLDAVDKKTAENKLAMIVFSGDLDKALAAFIIATGAVAMGMEVVMFFTFWGTPILRDAKKKVGGKEDEVTLFKMALDNIKPSVEVKSRRVGGANYQVPVEVPQRRSAALGLRWLVDAADKRGEKDMAQKLGAELLQAFNNEGAAIRKKVETHKMAEANKAFAHYRY